MGSEVSATQHYSILFKIQGVLGRRGLEWAQASWKVEES